VPDEPSDHQHKPLALPPTGELVWQVLHLMRSHGHSAAEAAFNEFDERTRAGLVGIATGRDRVELLLLAEDASELVRGLPAPELALTLQDSQDVEHLALLRCASPQQLQLLMDFDCWRGGAIDRAAFRGWMERLCAYDHDEAIGILAHCDADFLAAALTPFVTRLDIDRDAVRLAEEAGQPWHFNPSQLLLDDDLAEEFIERLYAVDPDTLQEICRRLLDEAERDPEEDPFAELDEGEEPDTDMYDLTTRAHRAHSKRLEDVGLQSRDAASRLYRSVELPEAAAVGTEARTLRTTDDEPLLYRALRQLAEAELLEPNERERLSRGIAELQNRVLMARGIEREDGAEQRISGTVESLLSLGLERICGDDTPVAAQELRGGDLEYLFRVGYTLSRPLHERAERIFERRGMRWNEAEWEPVFELPPAIARNLERFGDEPLRLFDEGRGGERAVWSQRDLDGIARELDGIEAYLDLVLFELPLPLGALLDQHPRHPGEQGIVTSDMVLIANVENALLDRAPGDFRMPTLAEREALVASCLDDGVLTVDCRTRASAFLDAAVDEVGFPPHAAARVRGALDAALDWWRSDLQHLHKCHRSGRAAQIGRMRCVTRP